ncbi:MAPEG family protein [Ralstonia pseudosolanacearum]|uniref:MAPEG family protein n=1 Tax=Ralstonia pseudosolanacearum TaxID=1310165 RepID=UPI0008DAB169|nr:MAPEG family protein [Ralstonia pseudosolanacearum]MCL1620355.1 MAPEG family protein [Ralstonia pseudosolanacearum CaRs-Mep]MCQ4680106.1 MAPEG family protein [Ralstonia pseudosolanacearum]
MPIALWCVLIAALLPYVCIQIARFTGPRRDNRQPRQWAAGLTGVAQRANGAQQNHFEVFPFFAVAVLVAILGGSPVDRVNGLAVAFIAVRVLYTVCYLANWATARSLVWTVGFVLTIALFVQPAFVH